MRVLVAMDNMSQEVKSFEANQFVHDGIYMVAPTAEVINVPLFDASTMSEGVLKWQPGTKYYWNVVDGQGKLHRAFCSGVQQKLFIDAVHAFKHANTYEQSTSAGLGQMIQHGLDLGYNEFVISLGDVSVYDCGIGLLKVLGAKFFDALDHEIEGILTANSIKHVRRIQLNDLDTRLNECKFTVVTDESYYLYGEHSQIAMSNEDIQTKQQIDNLLWYFNEQLKQLRIDLTKDKSAGVGGGLQGVFTQLFNATIVTTKELIFQETSLEPLIEEADVIIFGGGRSVVCGASLVAQSIQALTNRDKINIYLTAGRQLPLQSDDIYQFNIYPEMTTETNSMQLGIQITNTVHQLLKFIQK